MEMSDDLRGELKNSILKSGTTILGIVCKDGIVMASDRQVTLGYMVHSKTFKKILPINDNYLMAIAGTVSDAQRYVKLISAELRLKELKSREVPSVRKAANLLASLAYSNIRQPSMIPAIVGSLFGGLNEDGTYALYTIGPDGSISEIENYDSNGSGSSYVIGLLERKYDEKITVKEGIELAMESLKSSTQRDIASGYGIDIFTITKKGISKEIEKEILPEYKDDKKN
jgi:proteasome beta subunit